MGWSGEDWQEHVIKLLLRRYGADLVAIPDRQGGDLGLEAFSRDGCAFQCYAAEEPLSVEHLTDKQRDKITRDLNKFVTNETDLLQIFGPTRIKHWILMVPRYESRRLLEHNERKASEIRAKKLSHVEMEFYVSVQDEKLLAVELQELVKAGSARVHLPTYHPTPQEVQAWAATSVGFAQNIERKVAKLPTLRTPEIRNSYRDEMIKRFIAGENLVRHLQETFPILHEKVVEVKRGRESLLEVERGIHGGPAHAIISDNIRIYRERLADTVKGFTESSLDELAWEAVADWLARCPLDPMEA
jgi:hypothetical protein